MKEKDNNPLGLENKLYNVEEFGSELRKKFGGYDYISNIMLAEMFLAKYPVYSCKLKNQKLTSLQKTVVVVKFTTKIKYTKLLRIDWIMFFNVCLTFNIMNC